MAFRIERNRKDDFKTGANMQSQVGTTNPCAPGGKERRSLGLVTKVPVLQASDSE